MITKFSFDHVIIVVEDLNKAIKNFEALGFGVVPGGVHTGNFTHNALIPFQDGTYIELLAPTSNNLRDLPALTEEHPQMPKYLATLLNDGEGLASFALWVHGIESAAAEAISRNVPMTTPHESGRKRHDGHDLLWKVSHPHDADLPFFIEDITQRTLRAPAPVNHKNGVIGMGGITIATRDVKGRSAKLRDLLGSDPLTTYDSHISEKAFDLFAVRLGTISVVPDSTAKGMRPARMTLKTRQRPGTQILDPDLTHGALIVLIEE